MVLSNSTQGLSPDKTDLGYEFIALRWADDFLKLPAFPNRESMLPAMYDFLITMSTSQEFHYKNIIPETPSPGYRFLDNNIDS